MTNIEKMLIEALKQVELEREQDRQARGELEKKLDSLTLQLNACTAQLVDLQDSLSGLLGLPSLSSQSSPSSQPNPSKT